MNYTMIWLAGEVMTALIVGASIGYSVALKYTRKQREREQAEMQATCKAMVDCVSNQHKWMQSLTDGVQAIAKQRAPMLVDWSVLTSAANGAGFTLVKAEPRAAER